MTPPRLDEQTALEIASGTTFGPHPAPPLPAARPGVTPRQALEEVVAGALRRGPCGVSFSGGRDSSSVLAVATAVARREGLPLPVPITHVFPAAPESREDSWQELVVRSLGLSDWVRLSWDREMDVLGPFATAVLRRVGLLDPFNAFFHEPLCQQVAGGTLLTGIGGDELLGGVSAPAAFRVRHRGRRPKVRQLPALALSYAPGWWKARRIRRRHPFAHTRWMRPEARIALEQAYSRWLASDPLAWDAGVRHFWGSRECHLGLDGLDALGAAHDVVLSHPLNSPEFVTAMISTYGARGPGGRGPATQRLVGDLLPAELCHRGDKAAFGGAFWTGASVGFADSWSGGGVDGSVVDEDLLRAEWRRPGGPHVGSLVLLQQAWLHDDGR